MLDNSILLRVNEIITCLFFRYLKVVVIGRMAILPEDMYRQHYIEDIDLAVNCIQDRFQQPGFEVYRNLEQLLLKASQNFDFSAEFTFVTSFYGDDLQTETLHAQLLTFATEFK